MASKELYALLGLSEDASDAEVRKAYRNLARKHHPDLNPDDAGAEERFKQVSAAYEVLSDPKKRALYDEFGDDAKDIGYDPERAEEYRQWRRRAEASAGFRGRAPGPFGQRGAAGGVDPADLEELLASMFGARGGAAPSRGGDIDATLQVSFRDAALGAKTQVVLPDTGGGERRVTLSVPAGVREGQRLRLAGQGLPGPAGTPPGDLYVRIAIAKHPVFTRDDLDLSVTVPITVSEALLGAKVEVPTLTSTLRVKVPAAAQSGQRLRLEGKGIRAASGETGDLYATLAISMPEGGDPATRERIAAEIAKLYERDVRADLQQEASR